LHLSKDHISILWHCNILPVSKENETVMCYNH
jgi:hypothetical protein